MLRTISTAVLHAIQGVLDQGPDASPPALAAGVKALSEGFTKSRPLCGRRYLDQPDLLPAYLTYYLPVNLAKVQSLLDELPGDTLTRQASAPLRLLDVGSGPGTASLALLDWLVRRNAEGVAVSAEACDHSPAALAIAKTLWDLYAHRQGIQSARFTARGINLERTADLRALCSSVTERFHLVCLANSLNELFGTARNPVERRCQVVLRLLDVLRPDGSLIIVEPALRDLTRDLHRLRDLLTRNNVCTLYSPCLHEDGCPALHHPEDWCHEERAWAPPAEIRRLDREVGFIKDSLKFSYLILRKDGRTVVPRARNVFRIVSERREFKGETRLWTCSETGRLEVGRLDRERSASNAEFDQVERGAIMRWVQPDHTVLQEGRGRIHRVRPEDLIAIERLGG
ncbi:MAG: small ribosomal subunit Rsm22 family protein [Nitrospiraceae bacterium]